VVFERRLSYVGHHRGDSCPTGQASLGTPLQMLQSCRFVVVVCRTLHDFAFVCLQPLCFVVVVVVVVVVSIVFHQAALLCNSVKLEFHDTDTDILADSPDTSTSSRGSS